MNTLREKGLGILVYAIIAFMAIASLFVYISNVNKPYYEDMNQSILIILICAVVALILTVALPFVSKVKGIPLLVDALRVAAAVLLIQATVQFLGMRVESFGYIFGSNLELGNDAAFEAGNQAMMGITLMGITWVLSILGAFLRVGNKK